MKMLVTFFSMLQCLILLQGQLFAMEVPVGWEHRSKESRMQEVGQVLQNEGFSKAQELLVNPNVTDAEGNNVLLWFAAHYGWSKDAERLLDTLLEVGADVNHKNQNNGYTPLLEALSRGDAEMAEWLIKKGADVNVQTQTVETVDRLIANLESQPARKNLSALVAQLRLKQVNNTVHAKLLNKSIYELSAEVFNKLNKQLLKVSSLTYEESSRPFKFSMDELPLHVSLEMKSGVSQGLKYGFEVTDSFLREIQWGKGERIDLTKLIVVSLNWDTTDRIFYPVFEVEATSARIAPPRPTIPAPKGATLKAPPRPTTPAPKFPLLVLQPRT